MKLATRIMTLVMAMLMVLSLAACASETPTTTPADTTPSTTEPADTTVDEPADTSDEPADTADEPVDEPADTTTEEPADTTEEPADTTTEHLPYMQYITADVCETSNIYSLPLVTDGTTLEFWWPLFANYTQYDLIHQEDYAMFKTMNERTGVNVELTIPTDAATQFGLMMASDDIPDYIMGFANYYSGGLDHAVEEDLIADLSEYEDIMPNLFTVLRSNEMFWKEANTDSGYIPGVPHIQSNLMGTADRSWMGYAIRQDWLDKLGMEVPTTYDEMETVLLAMKSEGFCEYPFLLHGMQGTFMLNYGSKFWGGYGVDADWYQIDGQVLYGPLQDGYRDYIQMLVDWRAQGLFEDTFLNAMGDGGYMTVSATDVIASDDSVGVLPVNYTMLDPMYEVNAHNPDYALSGVPFLKLNEEDQIHIGRQAASVSYSGGGAIMLDGEHVELVCKWWDYMFSEEGFLIYNYGVEGESFNFDETGKPVWITEKFRSTEPGVTDHQLWHQQVGFNSAGYHQFDREFVMYSEPVIALYDVWYNSYDIEWNYPAMAALTAEEGEDYSHIMSDINTFLNENLAQFLTGARPMSEWEDFRTTLAGMGVDEAQAIKQASLDRYNAR